MKKLFLLTLLFLSYSVSVKAIDVQTKPLSDDVRSFIEKDYDDTEHKLVLYHKSLAEYPCVHIQYYFKFLKKIMNEEQVQEIYTLRKQPREPKNQSASSMEKYASFMADCGFLCVVSLENNWIYPITKPYWEEDVERLMDTLDALAYQ